MGTSEALETPPVNVARRVSLFQRLQELLRFRGLIANLTVRDLKARYKNSVLGFLWTLVNPLGMMLVFTLVFTVLAPSYQIEKFPVFLLCGLLPWYFFSNGVTAGTTSIIANGNLVRKAYFPREALPVATVLASLVNFLLALIVLFALLFLFRVRLSPYLWVLPAIIVVQTCFVLGLALILSTLSVFYRDTVMILDVILLAWFFLTPVFYPIEILPRSYEVLGVSVNVHRLMYILNPMASLISAYRDVLYWGYRTDWDFFLRTTITVAIVLVFGYWFFHRYSHRFGEEA